MNKLYFGDNFEILREIPENCVHLICTDPPFNSGRDYNAFIADSLAQKKAFTDIWTWDTAAENAREDTQRQARSDETYKALDECLRGYDLVLRNAVSGNKGSMRAYLAFMGPRLVEMHRVLREDGSIYLHCDPTASHYLKGLMDAIFDLKNRPKNGFFRNEIIWSYRSGGVSKYWFAKKHDIILFFTKASRNIHTFNIQKERSYNRNFKPYRFKSVEEFEDEEGRWYTMPSMRDVWEIDMVGRTSNERLGYPTQKPIALYKRMINASSNPDDIVLDPFCGCGTTIDAAHTLKRRWIGIDLTILALDPMRYRLADRHGLKPSIDYDIEGYPTNMQEVRKLVRDEKRYHDFSNWAVTRLGLKPTRDVGDGGHDGVGHFKVWTPQGMKETDARILAEVKSGKPTINQVRAFCYVMEENDAEVGIFITIERVSAGMREVAASMGTFEHNKMSYPRLQFWQITDAYFENPNILNTLVRLPALWRIQPTQKSKRHFAEEQVEFKIN